MVIVTRGIDLAKNVFAIEEARRGGIELFVMPGVAAMFDATIARGEGALDAAAAARAELIPRSRRLDAPLRCCPSALQMSSSPRDRWRECA